MAVDIVRDAAVDVLLRIFDRGIYLDRAIDKTLRRKKITSRGRRFMTQLVYGTVRHKLLCDYILEPLLTQPIEKLPRPVHTILRMGIFQSLFCNQVTRPAMVHTSVDLAKKRGHAGLGRLTNAVLRRAPETLDDITFPDLQAEPARAISVRHSMPLWIVERWLEAYGYDDTEQLCASSNSIAPVSLRTNTVLTTPEKLIANLAQAGCMSSSKTDIHEEITIVTPPGESKSTSFSPIHSKFFQRGHFFIQDPASMLPPHLIEPQPNDHILDMCAAPGGKTTHIAQLTSNKANITAMDISPFRLSLIDENVDRLNLSNISTVAGNGSSPPLRCEFDRILLDAPCSGLGTLRRNPDLKWRLKPEDIPALAEIQNCLLRSAIRLCKNDGLIVYSVCTVSREETQDVVRSVIDEYNVRLEDGPKWFEKWKVAEGQYRILPEKDGLDGFFLTRLRKVS